MLIHVIVFRVLQNDRSEAGVDANSAAKFNEGVALTNEEESAAAAAGEVSDSRLLTSGTLSRDGQTFNHQRTQIVLQYYIFEIAMKLGNSRMSTANRRELARVLRQKYIVK